MVKEAIEDVKRGTADTELNRRKVQIHTGGGVFQDRSWSDVRVGDILKVVSDEVFPADLLLLSSSDPDGNCYVETMNLDGETNLKLRKSLDETKMLTEFAFSTFKARLECEKPNEQLYSFVGNLTVGEGDSMTSIHLSPQQILLRGSTLRNTSFALGVVIFTGFETKIMLNATDPPSKRSRIEKRLDWIVLCQLILLAAMSLCTAIVFAARTGKEMKDFWYLAPGQTSGTDNISRNMFNADAPVLAAVFSFFTSFVLYGYFIPISLYVSIEIVKIFQALLINADLKMYYEDTDQPAFARTSNLNEELGQVQTVLSDKTGTLTRNEMEFIRCSIAGVSYGRGTTEVERAAAAMLGQSFHNDDEGCAATEMQPLEKGFNFRDIRLSDQNWLSETNADVIRRFLEILAVCHTVIPDGVPDPSTIRYMAESPDEAALVVAAKRLGFFFYKRSTKAVWVKEFGTNGRVWDRKYDILNVLEFNSSRKRMSVIVRDPDGQLLLFTKGADNVICERLGRNGQEFKRMTVLHMNEYAEAGLRTLALAYAPLDEQMFLTWKESWEEAKKDVRDAKVQAGKLDALSEEIEKNLILVGATAIEDKLQAGVPQTIDTLARAGIKLWVLTGDKMETAINIGYACSLLRHNMVQHILSISEDQEVMAAEESKNKSYIEEVSKACVIRQIRASLKALRNDASSGPGYTDRSHALIVDGKSLTYAVSDDDPITSREFLELGMSCESVICCRVSPKQKADVTALVKREGKEVCLSVGDGANDVGMIQEANIGVGISGLEGQQAVMAADFAIGQFRFLERLLLVHGGWCYKRISRMINYFFYKNFVFGFTIFFFNAHAFFAGQSIYADWYLSIYNVVFTSLPICVVAVLDQDVKDTMRIKYAALYRQGQKNTYFNVKNISVWLLNGVMQSSVIFFSLKAFYQLRSDRDDGKTVGMYHVGTTMYTCVVMTVNLQLAIAIQFWTWLHHFTVWGSICIWFIFLLAVGEFPYKLVGPIRRIFVSDVGTAPSFYLVVIVVVIMALLPDFVMRSFVRNWLPDDHHIVQEIQRMQRQEENVQPRASMKRKEGEAATPRRSPLILKAASFHEAVGFSGFLRPDSVHSPALGVSGEHKRMSSVDSSTGKVLECRSMPGSGGTTPSHALAFVPMGNVEKTEIKQCEGEPQRSPSAPASPATLGAAGMRAARRNVAGLPPKVSAGKKVAGSDTVGEWSSGEVLKDSQPSIAHHGRDWSSEEVLKDSQPSSAHHGR
ncbi:hypothetical protein CBR_g34949 [Chara braunii]|uniref:Phospholipid-transporting ATPase n=1 Tax=Chara braunii TaxID=69332 RepID=A0A388LK12_CHABU|nr:hypothetical protein CBR_g34949 [Chara braunii]|eukprot:GBG82573.1 hypothetical protein CBR_g34949 [Chara braunii]